MRIIVREPLGAGFLALSLLFAACSGEGTVPHSAAPAGLPVSPAGSVGHHAHGGKSWMAPGVAKSTLLYASDGPSDVVDVYLLKKVKPAKQGGAAIWVGQLTGFAGTTEGICVDPAGNVYITDEGSNGQGEVVEFAHGGTTPIRTITGIPYAEGCAFDPTTGNFAVSSLQDLAQNPGPGGVAVFAGGPSGSKTIYTNLAGHFYGPPGYDPHGNLFVAGYISNYPYLVELPSGGSALNVVSLDQSLYSPTSVTWDGAHVTVVDGSFQGNHFFTTIDQVDVSGSSGKIVRKVYLSDPCRRDYLEMFQVVIKNRLAAGGDAVCGNDLGFWRYPNGGNQSSALDPSIAPTETTGVGISSVPL